MSGIGASSLAIAVTRAAKKLVLTGTNWFREDIAVSITGFSPSTAENLVMVVYQGDTLVVTGQGFTGSTTASGTVETNTEELEVFMDAVPDGAIRTFDVFLWDAQSLVMLGSTKWNILGVRGYSASTPVTPITGSTVIWGNIAMYNGTTYVKSLTDGLWYPFALNGSGTGVTEATGTTGIVIPT